MLEQALGCGLVVIGSDLQRCCRSCRFSLLGEFDGLACAVGACARHDNAAPFGKLGCELHHMLVLIMIERR